MIVAWLATVAQAQVEVCAGSWTVADWDEALRAVDAALAELDGDLALAIVADVVDQARCTGEVVPRLTLAHLARQAALIAFHAQDPAELQAWGLLARELTDGPWPAELPAPARFHDLIAALPEPDVGEMEGVHLAPPKGGGVLVDGVLAWKPATTTSSEHLVQVVDKKGHPVTSLFVVGAAFPPDALGEETELGVPRWYEGPVPDAAFSEPAAPAPVPGPVAAPAPVPVEAPAVTFDGRAGSCPWDPDPTDVRARSRQVTVDGREWSLRSDDDRAAFRDLLRSCGELKAARRFARWTAKRGTLLAGAHRDRDAMVAALLATEPPPKRKPPAR